MLFGLGSTIFAIAKERENIKKRYMVKKGTWSIGPREV
jgi:hypothetical protein